MERRPITDQLIAALNADLKRSGRLPKALLKGQNDIPEGLNYRMINAWLARAAKTARADHLEYVANLWKFAPDFTPPSPGTRKRPLFPSEYYQPYPIEEHLALETLRDKEDTILISPPMRRALKAEQKRTNIGPEMLLLLKGKNRLDGLDGATVSKWMNGQIKQARIYHLHLVFRLWRDLPDRR